jgi:hypothetical protein
MNSIAKKIIIYSLVGIMQVGLGVTVIEASPVYNDGPQRIVQLEDRHDDNDRQQENVKRLRDENERHEREMRRRDHESDREYHERQRRENKRHENALHDIEILLTGISICSRY